MITILGRKLGIIDIVFVLFLLSMIAAFSYISFLVAIGKNEDPSYQNKSVDLTK